MLKSLGFDQPRFLSLFGYSLLRRDQIHQTRCWYEKNRILDALNLRFPGLIGIHLADQWRRIDPKAIGLDQSHDARINPDIEQPENYLLISQVGFVNHSGANYTPRIACVECRISGRGVTHFAPRLRSPSGKRKRGPVRAVVKN